MKSRGRSLKEASSASGKRALVQLHGHPHRRLGVPEIVLDRLLDELDGRDLADVDPRDSHRRVGPQGLGRGEDRVNLEAVAPRQLLA